MKELKEILPSFLFHLVALQLGWSLKEVESECTTSSLKSHTLLTDIMREAINVFPVRQLHKRLIGS